MIKIIQTVQQALSQKLGRKAKILSISQSPSFFLLILLSLSLIIGANLAQAINNPFLTHPSAENKFEIVQNNPSNNNYAIAQELYLENCATCHIPIPPEVLPTETWKNLLEKPQVHYGESLPKMLRLSQNVIWNYLKTFSRSVQKDEIIPYTINESRYFKALHPKVDLPKPVTHRSCILCHTGIDKFDYRSLKAEWQ